MDPVFFIFLIMVLGPVIGSFIGVLKRPSFGYVCNMLCFAAGVMLTISFLELIPESIELSSVLVCVSGIILGSLVMYGLDRLIPHLHPQLCAQEQGCNLERTAVYLILGMFLHNFPEGMAIAIGSVTEMKVSFVIAFAIAIHNVPEGICTSAPYFHTTGARLKSFLVSSSTAVPIVAGYVLARYLFQNIPPHVIGFIIGATAGLMVYITVDELIPNGCAGSNHQTIFSLIIGIIFVILLGLI
ncbi:MAG: ZIP family metal transporter [Thermodesulfobacteriota bacterium]